MTKKTKEEEEAERKAFKQEQSKGDNPEDKKKGEDTDKPNPADPLATGSDDQRQEQRQVQERAAENTPMRGDNDGDRPEREKRPDAPDTRLTDYDEDLHRRQDREEQPGTRFDRPGQLVDEIENELPPDNIHNPDNPANPETSPVPPYPVEPHTEGADYVPDTAPVWEGGNPGTAVLPPDEAEAMYKEQNERPGPYTKEEQEQVEQRRRDRQRERELPGQMAQRARERRQYEQGKEHGSGVSGSYADQRTSEDEHRGDDDIPDDDR